MGMPRIDRVLVPAPHLVFANTERRRRKSRDQWHRNGLRRTRSDWRRSVPVIDDAPPKLQSHVPFLTVARRARKLLSGREEAPP
jgi:hypothetical protein